MRRGSDAEVDYGAGLRHGWLVGEVFGDRNGCMNLILILMYEGVDLFVGDFAAGGYFWNVASLFHCNELIDVGIEDFKLVDGNALLTGGQRLAVEAVG